MCPKSIEWLHSQCAQVLKIVDSLYPMFVLLHIVWLPQRLWSTNEIVAGRWAGPTLHGVRIVLGAIIVGTTMVGTILEGVIVVFFFEVGTELVSFEWKLFFWALDSHDCSTNDSSLGAFGSPRHKLSTHDDSFLEAYGPPFHELSTHDDWFHPDTEQNKGISHRIPYSKQDPVLLGIEPLFV